ncbi:MAG TPA: SGNH/GDSL hydrolase family protein, partial [Burkholderiaceae bacterium]|nr:SGNH/GDSL hydrolase family protein [Burkholderiaceae bacterium]
GEREGGGADAPAALRLLIVGDSSAAGVGVAMQCDALTGQLADELGRRGIAPLRWRLAAATGAEAADAPALLAPLGNEPFDVAIAVFGVNDTTALRPPQRYLAAVERATEMLRQRHGVRAVLWSGLPPMHRLPALPQPLRWVLGSHARVLDRSLAAWCRRSDRADAPLRHVPLAIEGDRTLIASDGFHPATGACRVWARLLADAICRIPDLTERSTT